MQGLYFDLGLAGYLINGLWQVSLLRQLQSSPGKEPNWTLLIFLSLSLLNTVLAIGDLLLSHFIANFSAYNNHYMAVFYLLNRVCYSIFAIKQLELGAQLSAEGGDNFYEKIKRPLIGAVACMIVVNMALMNSLDHQMPNPAEYNHTYSEVFQGLNMLLSFVLLAIISVGLYHIFRSTEEFSNKNVQLFLIGFELFIYLLLCGTTIYYVVEQGVTTHRTHYWNGYF